MKVKKSANKFFNERRIAVILFISLLFWIPLNLSESNSYDICYKGVSSIFGGTLLEIDCNSNNVDVVKDVQGYNFNPSGKSFIILLIIVFTINLIYWLQGTKYIKRLLYDTKI
jgi:hypothetical protein